MSAIVPLNAMRGAKSTANDTLCHYQQNISLIKPYQLYIAYLSASVPFRVNGFFSCSFSQWPSGGAKSTLEIWAMPLLRYMTGEAKAQLQFNIACGFELCKHKCR